MTKRTTVFTRSPYLALFLLPLFVLGACRSDEPASEPATDTSAHAAAPLAQDTAALSGIPIAPADSAHDAGLVSTPVSGEPGAGPGWQRAELVAGVQRFITAIDSNNSEQFWGSLSERSLAMVERGGLGTREEVWSAARQTLGDIENRRITVIGGRTDSVALRIDGLRLIDSVREDDPIIIHLLREHDDWKVMYPGLLYPRHHLRK